MDSSSNNGTKEMPSTRNMSMHNTFSKCECCSYLWVLSCHEVSPSLSHDQETERESVSLSLEDIRIISEFKEVLGTTKLISDRPTRGSD